VISILKEAHDWVIANRASFDAIAGDPIQKELYILKEEEEKKNKSIFGYNPYASEKKYRKYKAKYLVLKKLLKKLNID